MTKIAEEMTSKSCCLTIKGKMLQEFYFCQDRKIVSIVSPYLSRADQINIKKYVWKNGPEIIDEIFQPSLQSMFSRFRQEALRYWVNILSFYDDRKRKPQFEKLVKTLLLLRTEYGQLEV